MKKDFNWLSQRYRDFLKGKFIIQLKIQMETKEFLTIPLFLIKKKIRLYNFKRKYRISKKDSAELQQGRYSLKIMLLNLLNS